MGGETSPKERILEVIIIKQREERARQEPVWALSLLCSSGAFQSWNSGEIPKLSEGTVAA